MTHLLIEIAISVPVSIFFGYCLGKLSFGIGTLFEKILTVTASISWIIYLIIG
jgi:hypothetical protein